MKTSWHVAGKAVEVDLSRTQEGWTAQVGEVTATARLHDQQLEVSVGENSLPSRAVFDGTWWWVWMDGWITKVRRAPSLVGTAGEGHSVANVVRAPMTGTVTQILTKIGKQVKEGEPLLKMEAMKMQYTLAAPRNGKVISISCKVGEVVDVDAELIELEKKS